MTALFHPQSSCRGYRSCDPDFYGDSYCLSCLYVRPDTLSRRRCAGRRLTPLKPLVGEWKGADADGKSYRVVYQLTSGGTSLTETLTTPDSPPMTTMYYTDGDQLMLTHYCSLNNQPHEGDQPEEGDKTVAFAFVDATNLKNPATPTCIR
ncbi:MAG: hypothetical protein U0231_03135 [Nitrospiraceae bacterium]